MPKSLFVDFRAVKAALKIEQVLQHYGILDQFKKSGDSLSGPCPIHKGSNPTQFRVSISKNIWNCFSECKHGGNVLDFISRMENVSIHAAAIKAVEWFNLALNDAPQTSEECTNENTERAAPTSRTQAPKPTSMKPAEQTGPNKALKFKLDKLEREHPYLTERGLSPETITEFGVGYCTKGTMAERIAIPIHNPDGKVVAYAGRWPANPEKDVPKYKLPQGFRKSLELFNVERAMKEPPEKPLVIVEGFFDCMKLHQNGCRKTVALMGSTMSDAQEEIINTHFKGHIFIVLDEDEAGRAGREDIVVRLAKVSFVRIYSLGEEDKQPEHLTPHETKIFTA
jgi:DNA primase